ncbi:3-hydroxyacyl-ACP dehydratase FabZ family protein [Flavobacteriaceae bacterium M23B6Z8]
MKFNDIIQKLPYQEPFLFVDELQEVNEDGIVGSYTFKASSDFYKGHFRDHPVTPGVILTECCAQIGLVCLGIYLMQRDKDVGLHNLKIGFSSAKMDFLLPVYPDEKVTVHAQKIYFRFQKLRCKVQMFNKQEQLVCKGELDGMLINDKNG